MPQTGRRLRSPNRACTNELIDRLRPKAKSWDMLRGKYATDLCGRFQFFGTPRAENLTSTLADAAKKAGVELPEAAWHKDAGFDWHSEDGEKVIAAWRRSRPWMYIRLITQIAQGRLNYELPKGKYTIYDCDGPW